MTAQNMGELARKLALSEAERNELAERVKEVEAALQDKCHNLPESDYEAFCDGCDQYQRDQFGKCRTDELKQKKCAHVLAREYSAQVTDLDGSETSEPKPQDATTREGVSETTCPKCGQKTEWIPCACREIPAST